VLHGEAAMKTGCWIGGLVTLALGAVIAQTASAGIITLINSTAGLFDGSSGTRTITFTGAEAGFDSGVITDVNVAINFAKADGESFEPPFPAGTPFYSEIHFHLIAPSSKIVHLIEPNSFGSGSPGTLFDGTIAFDDEAASVVNVNPNQPSAGSFRPGGPGALSDFDGSSALGTWTLFIQDTNALDALRFRNFSLEIATTPIRSQSVPEPATAILVALGLAGLALVRQRAAKR
jgi:hypothetical protein